jgi:hypothetical protein
MHHKVKLLVFELDVLDLFQELCRKLISQEHISHLLVTGRIRAQDFLLVRSEPGLRKHRNVCVFKKVSEIVELDVIVPKAFDPIKVAEEVNVSPCNLNETT